MVYVQPEIVHVELTFLTWYVFLSKALKETFYQSIPSITVVAIAQWIHLRGLSCGPGFESQAHHVRFFICSQILCYSFCHCVQKRTKINQKRLVLVYPLLETQYKNLNKTKMVLLKSVFLSKKINKSFTSPLSLSLPIL